MQENTILKVENLSVQFDGNKVLQDLSFEVKKGEIMAVVGPNGAGKTVLFRTLLGLVPYSGKFLWQTGAKVGYVPQRFIVERDMPLSVKEFLNYKGGKNKTAEVLKWVGLHNHDEHHLIHHLLNRPLGVLSGGELQKVLIAFALLGNPKVLLFDEPTTGIDLGGEETIYNLLKKLRDEHDLTVIFISHDIHVVYKYASSVLCINKEKVCFGPPHEALNTEELRKLYGADVAVYQHAQHRH
ncbi:MAG: metal ABC transporter ATP-binding protein [Parcubacteria group bacterium]|nr:metal ABC transporter ATP-binding protein [Parcubacteria group bacterium]